MPLAPPDLLRPRLAQPVAIFGAGASGDGARALVAALGGSSVIYDARGAAFDARAAQGHALAVFSPGFAPDHPWIALAREAGCGCMGEIDFASLCWRGRLVAITGTNGKTTLTEFLAHALGRSACATGNIGSSFSRLVALAGDGAADKIAICEVSSFQAETLRHFRAEAVLWTNFAEDHLERHRSLGAYFAAKANLAALSDLVFAGSSVGEFARSVGTGANFTWVATAGQPADPLLAGTAFADYPQRENFLLAAAWWRAAGLDAGRLYAAARSFRLGRHRLAKVAESDGVSFWNDSKATNFHAVEAALGRFEAPVLLIAGGRGKGGDVAGFARRIGPRIRHGFLIGETREEMAETFAANGVPHTVCGSLGDAVRCAAEAAAPGEHVVLSPGFASFDMFRSYEDRGDQFERAVREWLACSRVKFH